MKITVLTWNIHKGIGGVDRKYIPERIVAVLDKFRPDFACLQEVDEGVRRTDFHRQVDFLGDALGLRHRGYGPTHHLKVGRYGNAILSRWPLFDVHNFDLTISFKKRRGALCAHARVRQGRKTRTVTVFNLHLGLAGYERARQLTSFFAGHPFKGLHHQTPVIFAGDFNDLWGTLGPKLIEPQGFERAGKRVNTFPAVLPLRPLDGIFIRGEVETVKAYPIDLSLARDASDHLPLFAELRLV